MRQVRPQLPTRAVGSTVPGTFPGLCSASWVFPPLLLSGPSVDRYLGTSPQSSQWGSWGWSRPAGMRSQGREKGTKEEAFSQASLFSSPTGPGQRLASGHSPTTEALTPEVSPSPRGHRQLPPSGEAGVCEAGWGWRVVRTPGGQEWWRASRGHVDKSPARPGREASRVWL